MIKIAIIGFGVMGRNHFRVLGTMDGVEVVSVCDPNIKSLSEVRLYHDIDTMLAEVPVDAAILSVPTFLHKAIGLKCVEKGIDLLVEKPIASNSDDGRELKESANRNNTRLVVGHIERFNPAFIALENFELSPKFIECHRISQFNERGIKSAVIPELMIHDLDIILTIVKSKITHIEASGTPVLTENIDIANVRINFENGCVANITASRVSDKKTRKFRIFQKNAYINMDFLDKKTDVFALTKETEDFLRIAKFKLSEDNEKTVYYKKLSGNGTNAMVEEQKDFINAIKNDQKPIVTGEDGLAALKLALEIENIINKNLAKIND